jgi:CyaY protein
LSQGSIEQQYHQQLDALMMMIEDCIDELPQDVDVDGAKEIWVAAKSGGFHLREQQDQWFCAVTQERLSALLNRVVSEQSGAPVEVFTLIDA